jgi:hypothetical protein
MKKYIIEINIEESTKGSGIIAELMAEVEQEERELKIAKDINIESNRVHRKVLSDKIAEINEELSVLGIQFGDIQTSSKEINMYREFYSSVRFSDGRRCYITYTPSDVTKNEFTRYSIFSDNAKFRMCTYMDSYPSSWRALEEDEIFEYMRDSIKKEIKLNK